MTNNDTIEVENEFGKVVKTFNSVIELHQYAETLTSEQLEGLYPYLVRTDNTAKAITFDGMEV
jgi:hypothetical protein